MSTTVDGTSFTPFTAFGEASPAASSGSTSSTSGSDGVDTLSSNGSMYGLSTDDFLKLFLAQLQNQDPTAPIDNAQMLGELSQMTQIQTLQQVQKSLEGSQLAQSSALIGKRVTGTDVDGKPVDGVVSMVTQSSDAGLVLKVGSQYIQPSAVVNVTTPDTVITTS